MREDGLDFGSKDQPAIVLIIIERLDADAIARQHELFTLAVPQGDGKITFDLVDEIEPALFVEVKNSLAVGARSIRVPPLFQTGSQLLMVIDLAVEDQP